MNNKMLDKGKKIENRKYFDIHTETDRQICLLLSL